MTTSKNTTVNKKYKYIKLKFLINLIIKLIINLNCKSNNYYDDKDLLY
jgi:hypothetical protein